MPLHLASASHLDHALTPEHIAFVLALFHDRNAFFVETVTLPRVLADLTCALYGPLVGDAPVLEEAVSYVVRGGRRCASRVVILPVRSTRLLTVIGGPSDGRPCVLYTAYGGPLAPREPGDASLDWEGVQNARGFWAEHALAVGA